MKGLVFLSCVGVLLFAGCASAPLYHPKALQPESRGIFQANDTPYNCMAMGSEEGRDTARGTRGATRDLLIEGALNDLKNKANYYKDSNNQVLVVPRGYSCYMGYGNNEQPINCNSKENKNAISSVRVRGDIFRCPLR